MTAITFTKLQALGNDFILIDGIGPAKGIEIIPDMACKLCDRRLGVGADQLIWLKNSDNDSDVKVIFFNVDGKIAEMCGNGLRAVGRYLHKHSSKPWQASYKIETTAGVRIVKVGSKTISADMGVPDVLSLDKTITVGDETVKICEINVGNPHAVVFVEDASSAPIKRLGPLIERHPYFQNGTNVEFASSAGEGCFDARVWERSVGITMACGSGACAIVAAAICSGRAKSGSNVIVYPGGQLTIKWHTTGQSIFLDGPAEEVFSGEISYRSAKED